MDIDEIIVRKKGYKKMIYNIIENLILRIFNCFFFFIMMNSFIIFYWLDWKWDRCEKKLNDLLIINERYRVWYIWWWDEVEIVFEMNKKKGIEDDR
jgi:hypothetical protein